MRWIAGRVPRRRGRRLTLLAVVALAAGAPAARGDTAVLSATLDAIGAAPAFSVHTLAVSPREAGEPGGGLETVFVRALQARGFTIDPAAPVRLTYALRLESISPPRPALAIAGTAGSSSRAHFWLQVPLPENNAPAASGTPLQVWVTVARPGMAPLWQASLTVRGLETDPRNVETRMVAVLLDHWGETARALQLPLP